MDGYIITHDGERRRRWIGIFGDERLPVKVSTPRMMCLPRAGEVLAYDLDAGRLNPNVVVRFSHHIAKKYNIAFRNVEADGFPIPAVGCELWRDDGVAVGFSFMDACAN